MENVPSIKEACQKGECYFGTLETYILWNLTGGLDDGVHLTDVTNASRTMLMNLKTLDWDANLCHFFQIPKSILPQIRSCAEIFGYVYEGPLKGIPVAAVSYLNIGKFELNLNLIIISVYDRTIGFFIGPNVHKDPTNCMPF